MSRQLPDGGVRIVAGDLLILERPAGTEMPPGWTVSADDPTVWRRYATVSEVSYVHGLIVVTTL